MGTERNGDKVERGDKAEEETRERGDKGDKGDKGERESPLVLSSGYVFSNSAFWSCQRGA
ncbi:MAG: hypothetical protein F6J93_23450 [Oscillatoria sp. SIO1A7]|nr:hypothetical protein [Oscillatoria sp. SIO1A7]